MKNEAMIDESVASVELTDEVAYEKGYHAGIQAMLDVEPHKNTALMGGTNMEGIKLRKRLIR